MTHPVEAFFRNSELLDYLVLKPLFHMQPNWELGWDDEKECYVVEEDSFAGLLNCLVNDLAIATPPHRYHDNEDRLAEYVKAELGWEIRKAGNRWIGADYGSILEQGGFDDVNQKDLLQAAAGRIQAALDRRQMHFDEMEESHRQMLGAVLSIILYHRG